MKLYLMSLGAGLLVGIIYALINVRSPAPPVIALIGLFGILVGEQIPPLVKGYLQEKPAEHAWLHQVRPHMFGHLPGGRHAGTHLAQFERNDPAPGHGDRKKE